MSVRRRAGTVVRSLAPILALLLARTAGHAQEPGVAFLPQQHWSLDAARTLASLGLVPDGHDIARRAVSQRDMAAMFRAAVARARTPEQRARIEGLARRFEAEFGTGERSIPGLFAGSSAEGGLLAYSGRLRTGWGYGPEIIGGDWRPPEPRRDIAEPYAAAALQAAFGPMAIRFSGTTQPDAVEAITEAYATGVLGPLHLWLGRRELGWGTTVGPSMVLNRGRYDSFGVQTRPFRLPWVLERVGPVSLDFVLGVDDFEHSFPDVAVLVTRGAVTPHPRVQAGVTRAAHFGGEGNTDADLFALFSVLIGKHAGNVTEFDNQVVAVDFSYRPPVERWLPVRAYLEWGFEDSAGAFRSVPGIHAGIDVPALPGLPGVGVALEHASFARSCCGNPIWYRHLVFYDGWTQDGEPLGHPLGGHGSEWRGIARVTSSDGRIRVQADLFERDRLEENLYDPLRRGRSIGAAAWTELDLGDSFRLRVEASGEDGAGWTESTARVALRFML